MGDDLSKLPTLKAQRDEFRRALEAIRDGYEAGNLTLVEHMLFMHTTCTGPVKRPEILVANLTLKPVLVFAWEDYRGDGWGDLFGDFETLEEGADAALRHLEDPDTVFNNCADVVDLRSGRAVTFQREEKQVFRGDGDNLDQARIDMRDKIRAERL